MLILRTSVAVVALPNRLQVDGPVRDRVATAAVLGTIVGAGTQDVPVGACVAHDEKGRGTDVAWAWHPALEST